MRQYQKICKQCSLDFTCNRAHKEFCSRGCYRKYPPNKVKYANRTEAYLKTIHKTFPRKYSKLLIKCKSKKYDIDISKEEYEQIVNRGCDYCGKKIDETGVSLDRKDSKKGYTKDNIVPCCGACNQIKNVHLTYEEMKAAMLAVSEVRNGKK